MSGSYEEGSLYNKLNDEEKEFYRKFNEEFYTNDAKTDWGKERRAARSKDIYTTHGSEDYFKYYYLSAYLPGFDNAVNREIDLERGVCHTNDLAPGLVRTSWGYKCSVWTPDGYVRKSFMTEEAARQWIQLIKDRHKDYVHDVY